MQLQPDTQAVLQEEEPPGLTTVPVCVTEIRTPVRVKNLPNLPGSTRTVTAHQGDARRVLTADRYRARVQLVGVDGDVLVAFTENDASDASTMAQWPKGVPLEIRAAAEVWLAGATADTHVSIITERWATSG